ncbi:MAG: cytochrome c biogenesis protein [Candidatus Marinimicrobia bacterium]|nr:cytochrome c biogenesis protein [Candidatus Neomarinimicrobiota bacterium]
MTQAIKAINVLLPLIYGISLGLYIQYFSAKHSGTGKLASRLLLTGIVLHLAYLVSKGIFYQYFPITNSFESFSMIAFDVALIYYFIERLIREDKTGLFFLTIVFLFQIVSSMFIVNDGIHSELLSNPMFGIHTSLTLLGLSALAVSALYGLMYWMLAKEIKGHRFGAIYEGLPALETLENMGRMASLAGLIMLGFGIFLGHLWAYKILGYFFKADPKIVITDIAWLAYAIGWVFVWKRGLSGLRLSRLAFWGFILFFLAIMVVNILGDTFHKFT